MMRVSSQRDAPEPPLAAGGSESSEDRSRMLAPGLIAVALVAAVLITVGIGRALRVSLERKAVSDCRSWLPAVAQGRLENVQNWLEEGLRDAAVVADHPDTMRVLSGTEDARRLTELLDSVVRSHGFTRIRLRGRDGRILADSGENQAAATKPFLTVLDAGGLPSVDLTSDPKVGDAIVFRQPVAQGGRRGFVEIVDHSVSDLVRLMAPPRGSPMNVQTSMVFPGKRSPVVVSNTSLSEPAKEAIVRLALDAIAHPGQPHFTRVALNGQGQRFAALTPVPGTSWWIVATVGRKRVLGMADSRARRLTWLTASLIATIFAIGLAGWRHTHVVHLREVARSQARYRAIFESAPVALIEADLTGVISAVSALQEQGIRTLRNYFKEHEAETRRIMGLVRILSANESAITLYGVSSAGELAQTGGTLAFGDDFSPYAQWLGSLAAGDPLFEAEISMVLPGGERRIGFVRIQNPASPEEARHSVVSILDITSKKRAEEALAEAEERYRTLFQGAADAIFIHDLEGRILEVNEVACRQLGYACKELAGMTVQAFTAPEEVKYVAKRLEELRRDGRVTFASQHVARDGRRIPVEINGRIISYRGRTVAMSIVRDITQRETALAEIRFLNRLLEIRSRANRIIAEARNPSTLLDKVCASLVDEGGFGLAWIVTPGGSGGLPRMAAAAGPRGGFLAKIRELFERGNGLSTLCGEVLRSGTRRVIQDLLDDTGDMLGLRQAASESGFRALAVVPIVRETGVMASLAVCSRASGVFSDKVVVLLEELGADLGFALQALEIRRALERSEQRYRLLFERNLAGVYRSSVDGRIIDCNAAFAQIFGFASRQELLQAKVWDLYPSPEIRHKFLKTLSREKALVAYEQPMQRKDGSPLWIVLSASLIEDKHGELHEIEGTLMDLTERRRVEEDLERTAQRLEEAQRIAHVGNWEWDPGKDVSYWSEELYRIAGLEPCPFNTPVSRRLEHVHPDDRDIVRRAEETLFDGEDGYAIEYRLIRPDGTVRVVLDRAEVVRGADGRPIRVFGTVQDLTGFRALEEQLRQAQKMEAIGRLAGGVAHDFNNILQAMMMFTDELGLEPSDPKKTAKVTDALKEQLQRAASLTRQLLLFSRRETAKPERLDLNEVVSAMTAMLQRLVREDIQFSVVTGKKQILVTADRSQLEQVVMNLVVNAVDAMPEGGQILVKTLCRDEKPGWGCLEIVDTGHGIPEDIRGHIFDPFFTTKEAGHGTGLGLSVVHGIVAAHGGKIDVASTPGKGTTFIIRLPLARGERKEPSGAHPPIPEAGRGERVLLVEDNPAVREGLQDTLESLGYTVTAVESAEAAEAYAEERPDILLTDQILPGKTGLELATSLRSRWPGIPIILMSGYSEDEALKGMVSNGQIRFLQKPAPLAQLAGELRAALDEAEDKPQV
ncbi:MAG: PAS domain S-box protein [Acidobacteria bacterium]|nr:PAS domain S-box protein [Acidobacteriota bacterium]